MVVLLWSTIYIPNHAIHRSIYQLQFVAMCLSCSVGLLCHKLPRLLGNEHTSSYHSFHQTLSPSIGESHAQPYYPYAVLVSILSSAAISTSPYSLHCFLILGGHTKLISWSTEHQGNIVTSVGKKKVFTLIFLLALVQKSLSLL